jgi:beta-galactosidase
LIGEAEYTKVALGVQDKPVIAVRPVNHTHDKHSPSSWKMTNAQVSWSWNGCDGKDAVVEVYSKDEAAELFINGKSVGKKKRGKNCVFTFKTKYQPGTILVKTYDKGGNVVNESQLESAGVETKLNLLSEENKGNLLFVNLQYTDGKGIWKPLEKHKIKLSVKNGKLLAFGNACPFNKEGYLGDMASTYWGRALAVIKMEGDVEITADDGVRQVSTLVARG